MVGKDFEKTRDSNSNKGRNWWIVLNKIMNFPSSKDSIKIEKIYRMEEIFAIKIFEKVLILNT